MGILLITWNFPPRRGGIECLIGDLCAGLRQNHSVAVVTAQSQSPPASETAVFRAPWPGLVAFGLYAFWRGARLLGRDPEKKIIFGGSAIVTPLVLILARLFGRKAVVQTHGLDIIYANIFYQFLCVRWLKHCDRVVANSTYTASLAKDAGVPANLITVIPPGVDLQRFAAAPSEPLSKTHLGLQGKKIIFFVGRLAKRKGVKEFIEKSFVNIVRAVPEAFFVIVGDNPKESLTHRDNVLSEIKTVVSQLGLSDNVRLLGAVSEERLISLYRLCDVVVLPALATKDDVEGFGIVLIEAAAAGKPAVATRVGGIPDAVEDGKSGILVEPGDYEQMTEAMIRLLRNHGLLSALGDYGLRHVRENFDWAKIAKRYEQALSLSA